MAEPSLVHTVYFSLKNNDPAQVRSLIDACHSYLTDHPGVISFGVGTHVTDLTREVNHTFDVSLHVHFETRSAHDAYQVHPRHLEFIATQKDSWQSVRIYDAYLPES